jgi:AraC-like DNA-binding protein
MTAASERVPLSDLHHRDDSAERLFFVLPGDRSPGPETGTGSDRLTPLPIPPDLGGIATHALVYRETFGPGAAVRERVLPEGATRIAANLAAADPRNALFVLGPTSSAELVQLTGEMDGLSLSLAFPAARSIIGCPLGEIAEDAVPLDEFWGAAARVLAEKLLAARDDETRAHLLWRALREQLSLETKRKRPRPLPPHPAPGPLGVFDCLSRLALGERRLQQLCKEHVGLGPRTIHRLSRWHGVLRSLRQAARPDWASLAHEHGYCDQSHLVREFRAFSDLTPSAYHSRVISVSSNTAA